MPDKVSPIEALPPASRAWGEIGAHSDRPHWGMVVDTERCLGCWSCAVICKSENNVPLGGWWNRILTEGEALDEPRTQRGALEMSWLPLACQHCENAPCVKACPVAATYHRDDGLVMMDNDRCIGCRYCMIACPYGVRTFNWGRPARPTPHETGMVAARPLGTVEKCTMCVHRVPLLRGGVSLRRPVLRRGVGHGGQVHVLRAPCGARTRARLRRHLPDADAHFRRSQRSGEPGQRPDPRARGRSAPRRGRHAAVRLIPPVPPEAPAVTAATQPGTRSATPAGARRRTLPSRPVLAWLAVLAVLIGVGAAAFAYQFATGLVVTGMRNTVMWGQYILFFMFFIGLSAGGLIVASAGRLFGVKAFKPITRLAVLEATVAVMLAGLFILPDLGRPERVINILLHPNLTSPMVWDITIVIVYTAMSMAYVWLYARADLARRGSVLALGTGVSEKALARDERIKSAMAWVALPAAILLHSITAWIFGLQISRGFWYSAIMAPMFVASALVSGLALVTLLALVVRRVGRIAFGDELVAFLGGLLGVFIAVEAFFVGAEFLTAAYPGSPAESGPVTRLLVGPFAPLFFIEAVGGLGVPFLILAVRRTRTRPGWVALASVIAIGGIFVHRLNLILNGLSYAPIGVEPGVSIGVWQGATTSSFAMSNWYVPTIVEWLVVVGILAVGALLFTIAVALLPIQEPADH
jgi:molybdopterin-containing oxidoreductase family membrane subunit